MNTTITGKRKLAAYNKEVKKAHASILGVAKNLISTVDRHELRCILLYKVETGNPTIIHRLISPLLYLSLEVDTAGKLVIHYGFEVFERQSQYSSITQQFVRMLYRVTGSEYTSIDIEASVTTNYVVTDCSALYEIKEDDRNYTLKVLTYKATDQKQLQSVT